MAQPAVGIFWLIGEKVLIDATPVDDAEDYADHKTHGRSHDECWAEMVRSAVPDGDYEEHPRGRVVFNSKTHQFTMYADECILRQRKVVRQIMRRMSLPSTTAPAGMPTIAALLPAEGHRRTVTNVIRFAMPQSIVFT